MGEKKTRYEVILAGSGGQGLVLAGIMLGEAAMQEGRVVAQTQTYEAAARGGFSMAEVVVDREEILFQQVQRPDLVLALTEESMDKFAHYAREGAPVYYDTTLVKPRRMKHVEGYSFTQIASDRGNVASINVLALGAIIAKVPMVKKASMEAVLRSRFRGAALDLNLRVFAEGARLVEGR
ncbi:MAG: 2-oxoacid:acceptor oxidoreductase family protein [Deltaproteobacteria bacterium]|nr:2-oxoacid:acceptor oxidoreductase family protein [Deltaproteobacteria bacterium]